MSIVRMCVIFCVFSQEVKKFPYFFSGDFRPPYCCVIFEQEQLLRLHKLFDFWSVYGDSVTRFLCIFPVINLKG